MISRSAFWVLHSEQRLLKILSLSAPSPTSSWAHALIFSLSLPLPTAHSLSQNLFKKYVHIPIVQIKLKKEQIHSKVVVKCCVHSCIHLNILIELLFCPALFWCWGFSKNTREKIYSLPLCILCSLMGRQITNKMMSKLHKVAINAMEGLYTKKTRGTEAELWN